MSLTSWLKNLARTPAKPVALEPTSTGGGRARGGVKPPQRRQGPYSWSLQRIREVRDQQMRGCFDMPVRLAEAFRTDDALFTAYQARCATQSAIALSWQPSSISSNTRKSKAALKRAEAAIQVPQHVRQSILGTMANHGLAIGYVEQSTVDTASGPTVAFTLTEWPLEFVRYIIADGTLETRVKDGGLPVKITHGDGRWVVFAKFGVLPWTQDACLLPAALLWAAHAEGLADWAGASAAHGQPRVVGELPEGMPLGDGQGGLSPDAAKFLDLITDLINGEAAAGIRPAGAKTDWIANQSSAWQVFTELINNREGAAAKIYLGTDAILGARGGAPGVDVAALFGIATTRIQGDLEALERGFFEGVILPWCGLHGIETADAPRLVYELPDVDKDKRSEQEGAAITRLADAVDALKRAGLIVNQDMIDELAKVLSVSVSCVLDPKPEPAPAPTGAPSGSAPDSDGPDESSTDPEDGAPASPPAKPRVRVLPKAMLLGDASPTVVAAETIDADDDGKINEEDAADAADAADKAIDGDGDGKLDEEDDEDPRITTSRRKVARALEKFEKKQAERQTLRKERDDALAARNEYSNEEEINDRVFAGEKLSEEEMQPRGKRHDAEAKVEAAEARESEAQDALDFADEEDADAVAAASSELDAATAEHKFAKSELKVIQRQERVVTKKYERVNDRLENEGADDTDALGEAMAAHEDAHLEVVTDRENELRAFETKVFGDSEEIVMTPEQEAEHARLTSRHEKASAEHDKVADMLASDGRPGDTTPDEDREHAREQARTILTGPNGGQYYINDSGEKEYVK